MQQFGKLVFSDSSAWLLWEAWQREDLTQVCKNGSDGRRGTWTCLSKRKPVEKHLTPGGGGAFVSLVGPGDLREEVK